MSKRALKSFVVMCVCQRRTRRTHVLTIGVARSFADTWERLCMPRVIVCDVNETLLSVGALEPHFQQTFDDGRVLQEWFAKRPPLLGSGDTGLARIPTL